MMTEWMNKWLMAIFCWMIFMPVPDLLAQSAKTKDDPRITLRMKRGFVAGGLVGDRKAGGRDLLV